MGFWQRVPDETEAVDFCVESLGWVGLGWVGLGWVGLVGWLVGCFLLSFFVLEGQEFANRVFAVARLLTSTSSNTMSFVVAELMSLCDPAETVKLGEWPESGLFSHRIQSHLVKSWVFRPLYPKEPL